MSRPMSNDPRYHRGPLPAGVHTPEGRERIKDLISETRAAIRAAGDRKERGRMSAKRTTPEEASK